MDSDGHTEPGKSLVCKLVEIIVAETYLLDRCDDDTLDPDTAVMRLEDIGDMLSKVDQEECVLFLNCLEELAAEAVARKSSAYSEQQDWVDFINSFAKVFCLGEDEIEE